MNNVARGVSSLATSMIALALASLVGCGGVVSRGGNEGGGGAGGGTTDPGTGGAGGEQGCDPAACPGPAIAMSHAQFAVAMGEDPNGGPWTDTQYLQFGGGTQTPTCGAPFGTSECGGWTGSITLPTSWLTPGMYSLSANEIDLYYTGSFNEGDGTCSGVASGGFQEGEVVITEVTEAEVRFTVQGLGMVDVPVVGQFIAQRCPVLD